MKRFFFISGIFHVALLLLLYSWEVPLADRSLPRNIIQVSLVEKIEEKKIEKVITPTLKELKKVETPEKKEVSPILAKKEEKIEEKIEQAQAIVKEEVRKEEKQVSPENKALIMQAEQPLVVQMKIMPESQHGGNPESMGSPPEGKGDFRGREGSGSTFLASVASGGEAEGIGLGGGSGSPGQAKGEGSPGQITNSRPSSGELDSVLLSIIRKIEAAKHYPRMARKMGIEGKAVVRFKMRSEGQVEAVELVDSSGSEILDNASVETVRAAAPFPYKEGWLKVGIVFKILLSNLTAEHAQTAEK
jgi:protein TonB